MSANSDAKISEYYALRPTRFRVLQSFVFGQRFDASTGEMLQNLELTLASDESFAGDAFHLTLKGVRDLKFKQPSFSLVVLSHVEIKRFQADSFNSERYLVTDPEEDLIWCSCDDFSATIK